MRIFSRLEVASIKIDTLKQLEIAGEHFRHISKQLTHVGSEEYRLGVPGTESRDLSSASPGKQAPGSEHMWRLNGSSLLPRVRKNIQVSSRNSL